MKQESWLVMLRYNYCEIDLEAIRNNVRVMRSAVAGGADFLAVVKADGYGHGAVPVARAAIEAGAVMLAVAIPEEGVELREAGIDTPILVLGGIEEAAAEAVVRHDLTQVVFDEARIRALSEAGARLGKTAKVHLKLDTGMNRIGVRTEEEVIRLTEMIDGLENIELTGCFTHMATADEDERADTYRQIERFEALCRAIASVHPERIIRHAANTASIFRYPQAHFDMVRGGIALYGYPPVEEAKGLMPAMRWAARAVYVKEIMPGDKVSYGGLFEAKAPVRVMTVPVGYADGYRRGLTGRGCVLVRGQRAPILGRVCMDQIMVDVTHIDGAQAGDEVVLLGAQGEEMIDADEMAAWLGTISYEVICSPSRRVPRIYKNA
ncbi:MAG: alanine racemase [Clostridia bacterium]|nr:alanine racemase [Clostridia bacterium]